MSSRAQGSVNDIWFFEGIGLDNHCIPCCFCPEWPVLNSLKQYMLACFISPYNCSPTLRAKKEKRAPIFLRHCCLEGSRYFIWANSQSFFAFPDCNFTFEVFKLPKYHSTWSFSVLFWMCILSYINTFNDSSNSTSDNNKKNHVLTRWECPWAPCSSQLPCHRPWRGGLDFYHCGPLGPSPLYIASHHLMQVPWLSFPPAMYWTPWQPSELLSPSQTSVPWTRKGRKLGYFASANYYWILIYISRGLLTRL